MQRLSFKLPCKLLLPIHRHAPGFLWIAPAIALALLGIIALPGSGMAQTAAPLIHAETILATVDNAPIKLDEIENKEIHDLRERLHDALSQLLHRVTIERLTQSHEEFTLRPAQAVTAKEIRNFYDSKGLQGRGTYEQLKDRIRSHIQSRNIRRHLARQFNEAVRQGFVVSLLKAPGEFLVNVPVSTAFIRGKAGAQVMILEFSDFQCPFCGRAQPTLKRLRARYGSRVAFGFRHFPLPFHTEADEAALAAECAREQGLFEPYAELLFQNRSRQYPADLKRYAKLVGVGDQAQFDQCLGLKKYKKRLDNDLADGMNYGVSGTPSFVVGLYNPQTNRVRGEMFSGAVSEPEFVAYFEKYLKRATH